jgi:hypothetical protein
MSEMEQALLLRPQLAVWLAAEETELLREIYFVQVPHSAIAEIAY